MSQPAPPDVPSVRSLLTPEGLAEPSIIHEQFRRAEAAGLDIGGVVVSYAEVTELLANRSVSSDRVSAILRPISSETLAQCPVVESTLSGIIAFRDPPDHTRLRSLLSRAFTPRVVKNQQPSIVAATDRLLGSMIDRGTGTGDLHSELTVPLPAVVVASMLGVPEADWDLFMAWALDIVTIVGSGNPSDDLVRKTSEDFGEMREYLGDLLARRRQQPADDLLTAMIEASDDEDRLTEDEIFANATFLMTAGHETATNMLSNGIVSLLRHPDELARLRSDPSLIASAAEEMLRYESPVQMTPRIAVEDGVLCGREVKAGQSLLLFLGAANRDPDRFEEPHRFDITRTDNRHVAFGFGTHFCLGAALARLELQTAMLRIIDRLPRLELATDELEWQPTIDFRGPTSLPVFWQV